MPMYGNESTSAPKPQFDMDKEAEDKFCKFVERLPEVYSTHGLIRLFDRGDYFSAHGPDALLVAHQVYKTTNVIKYLGSGSGGSLSATYGANKPGSSSTSTPSSSAITARGLPSVTISLTLTKAFLRECLTAKQMRVEIYEPEEGAAGKKNHSKWFLARTASPGNITQLEDLLFAQTDLVANAVSMALKVVLKDGGRTVGCAFVDVQERLIGVAEFVDDENFTNTESLLIQLGVKECILQQDEKRADHELSKLRTLVERCGVIVTDRRGADFMPKSVESDLNRLLVEGHKGVTLPEFDLKVAMSSLAALLVYLSLLSDISLHGRFRLHHHDLSQYMKLDASALKALNLMPNPQELGGNKNMSLFGLLNRCKTSQGQRLLQRWLKQPLVNKHEILERQMIVEAFFDNSISRRALQDTYLKMMPDFQRLCKKFHRGSASLEDVVRVYQAIAQLEGIVNTLEGIEAPEHITKLIAEKYLVPLREFRDQLSKYSDMVEETIDLSELSRHEYVLRPQLDSELARIKDLLIEIRDGLDEEHVRVGRDLGLDIEKKLHLEKHQVYQYSLRITKAEAGLLRGKKGYIDLAVQKSGSIFTTPRLKELSEEYTRLQELYAREQSKLVKEVVAIAASYAPVLEQLDVVIAAIDVCVSFAHVAASAPIAYVKPTLSEKGTGDVIVRGARHPCLEVQDDIDFISNDHEMRKDTSEFIVLTGPNMGGKSTYIRQIGVITLMAQIGSFVPADHAELPIFDCILARVGAGDSQLKGVSTFMAEMLETATILKSATKESLIIIDELGRGTSTYDGFGLAWAISEYIATHIRCFCLFATHFHELTTLDQNLGYVKNLHVEALVSPRRTGDGVPGSKQERDITLLYKVKEGICDQSFGIHVAELANFPDSVVKLAKRKAEELEDFGDGAPAGLFAKHSRQEIDDGTVLVKQFLEEWKARTEEAAGASGEDDSAMQLSEEAQVEELRKVAEEYRERFESSPWVQSLLEGF